MRKRVLRKRPATTVTALARQVKQLQKRTKLVTQDMTYRVADTYITEVVNPYIMRNLSNFSTWSTLFPSQGIDTGKNEMYWKTIHLDNLVTLDTGGTYLEKSTINFTYMVISRKDEAGTSTLVGSSNTTELVNNVDYVSYGGKAFMNMRKFNVHYVKRFTLTSMDTDIIQVDQGQIRFSHKIRVGKKVVAGDGAWQDMTNSPDPSDTYYAVLFNDNIITDNQYPGWQMHALMNVNQ